MWIRARMFRIEHATSTTGDDSISLKSGRGMDGARIGPAGGSFAANAHAGKSAAHSFAVRDQNTLVGRPMRAPSMPRPDFRLMESSPVLMSQCSMRTSLQDIHINAIAPAVDGDVLDHHARAILGCVAQLPPCVTVKPSQSTPCN